MIIQQIRNATIIIEYADKRILVDPMLSKKGSMPPFPFSAHQDQYNPLHDLPISVEEILTNTDVVLLTHLHYDHIDKAAYELMPKNIRILLQDERDMQVVASHGFRNVEIVGDNTKVGEVSICKAESQHGNFIMKHLAGHTSGYIMTHSEEKTLYLAGDTIWYSGVKRNLEKFNPEVIIVNAGGNSFHLGGPVIMDDKDVVALMKAVPNAKVFATHLEGVNHNKVTRDVLRNRATKAGIIDRLYIPEDGERVENI